MKTIGYGYCSHFVDSLASSFKTDLDHVDCFEVGMVNFSNWVQRQLAERE